MEATQVTMTAEEHRQYEAFKVNRAAEQKKAQDKENRETYKALVDETINAIFPDLQTVSGELKTKKSAVYDAFQKALSMKAEIYETPVEQRSNTFTNVKGDRRITLGQYVTDNYDDTVNEGITKVKDFIGSLVKDKDSKMLVTAILKLLAKDQQGNLKASRVMQLRKMAEESGSETFIDGVRIIEAAYRPAVSKFYVKAEYKNDIGAWVSVPLGMTEA